jgi:hypothetical protein
MSIEKLQEKNKDIKIYDISSENFKKYGRVVEELNFEELYKYMEQKTSIPEEGNVYVASVEEMESMEEAKKVERVFYGEMPIQIGYCNGPNSKLNGLEYHKGSEIDAAVTDLVLLLGKVEDIDNNTYSSEKLEAFYLKKGTIVELYGTTLHFAPCKVEAEGFKCIVVLPKGTNLTLEDGPYIEASGEKRLLTAKNKWLICHPERKVLVDKGVCAGIVGDNIEIIF